VEVKLGSSLDDMEREHIIRILRETGGNKKKAAEILGIERRTLYSKAKRLGIDFTSV
jgi:DNA-binding NtrC family response regulator